MEMKDRVALVTGAARGIGSGVALALARAGAHVAIADLVGNPDIAEGAEATAAEIREAGRRALVLEADVSSESSCQAMVARTIEELGGLDILVCNAGIPGIGKAEDSEAVASVAGTVDGRRKG